MPRRDGVRFTLPAAGLLDRVRMPRLGMRRRTLWTLRGLYDVRAGLWDVRRYDDHHHDDNLLPDDHGPVDLYRFVLGGVWKRSLSPRPDVRRRELGKLRVRRAAASLR